MNSLQPGLLPAPADFYQAARFALVVVLTSGIGFLAGARRAETALFTGWGIACLAFVTVGCLTSIGLAPVALVLAVLGAAGLFLRLRSRAEVPDGMAWRVLALGAPTLLILLSLRTTGYDDFSFWAPNLVALCVNGHFPELNEPFGASFMSAYPRGVAFSGYATYLLGPDSSPAGMIRLLATGPWWNMLLLLAAAAALANNLLRRFGEAVGPRGTWALAAFGILLESFLNPGFISKMTLTNMGDSASGSGLAMLTALLFELPGSRRGPRIVIEMACTAAAVVFVRQDNLALLFIWAFGAALGLLLWGGTGRWQRLGWLVMAALPAFLIWLIWTHYTAVQIPGGAHSLLPLKSWHWADYPATLRSAARVLVSKSVYTLLAIGFGVAFLVLLVLRRPKETASRLLLTATTTLVFGNAAFIMFTYLATSFTEVEVRTAVTFWRFLAQTAPAEMVALACLLPLTFLGWLKRRAVVAALCLPAALLPVVLLPTPFTFRTDLRFQVPPFLRIGEDLAGMLPAGAKLLLIDNSDGSGYTAWMIKFGLLELGGAKTLVTLSLAPQLSRGTQAVAGSFPPGVYVLVTQSQWRPPYIVGYGMRPWHAYLFHSMPSGLVPLKTWPIPRYGRKY
ncbi:MAG: hypothetical protein KGH75_04250 [Rhodospirillales bacterium]|nr:hypothetical protein [Rhodospirillales bacterium]